MVQVLAVTSEIYPLIKTGGLADVAGALPAALRAEKITCRTLIPGYPAVMKALPAKKTAYVLPELFGGKAQVIMAKVKGLDLFVLDAPHLYNRNGGPYSDGRGKPFADNDLRFAALGKAAALIGSGLIEGYQPDVVHAHDWQGGLAAAYLVYGKQAKRPGTVMTVHNLAFQGQFAREQFALLGLPPQAFTLEGVEYYGDVGFLKAGLTLSDRLTTVSPTYASEITTPEGGMGMDGLLRGRADRLSGILNGIDTEVWDPATDKDIASPFSLHHLGARAANKTALRAEFGLAEASGPLFAVVSRLSWQKGLDLLLEVLPVLRALDAQLVVLGSGEPELEKGFAAAAQAAPGRIACRIGYDEAGAHRIQAGADALIVPSRFEPCGLTQLCALRYGCVPVVARVGGLSDTIIDASPMSLAAEAATGVQFPAYSAAMLEQGLRHAAKLYADREVWEGMQKRGMATDVSWRKPAAAYAALYRDLAR